MLWTHSAAPRESTTFWPLWWRISLSIRDNAKPHLICFLPQYQRQRKCSFFQSVTKSVTYWRQQRCLDSYRQRQISQSVCEISSNWGKIRILLIEKLLPPSFVWTPISRPSFVKSGLVLKAVLKGLSKNPTPVMDSQKLNLKTQCFPINFNFNRYHITEIDWEKANLSLIFNLIPMQCKLKQVFEMVSVA